VTTVEPAFISVLLFLFLFSVGGGEKKKAGKGEEKPLFPAAANQFYACGVPARGTTCPGGWTAAGAFIFTRLARGWGGPRDRRMSRRQRTRIGCQRLASSWCHMTGPFRHGINRRPWVEGVGRARIMFPFPSSSSSNYCASLNCFLNDMMMVNH
jgi:hypothetical protein